MRPEEMRREIRRQEDEHRRLAPEAADGGSERNSEEARELEAAGWERRGDGPKAIWRKPEGGHWWVHYQALVASCARNGWPGRSLWRRDRRTEHGHFAKGEAVGGDLNAYITRADKRRRKLEGERPVLCARNAALEIRRGAA